MRVPKIETLTMIQEFRGGKGKGKGKTKHVGTLVRVITTAECARATKRTTAGQMAEHGSIREAARQAQMQAQDGTQASAIGATGEAASVHDKTATGMAIHKNNDKIREGRSVGARQRGEARTA